MVHDRRIETLTSDWTGRLGAANCCAAPSVSSWSLLVRLHSVKSEWNKQQKTVCTNYFEAQPDVDCSNKICRDRLNCKCDWNKQNSRSDSSFTDERGRGGNDNNSEQYSKETNQRGDYDEQNCCGDQEHTAEDRSEHNRHSSNLSNEKDNARFSRRTKISTANFSLTTTDCKVARHGTSVATRTLIGKLTPEYNNLNNNWTPDKSWECSMTEY